MEKQEKQKQRNPYHDHPLLRKGGRHTKVENKRKVNKMRKYMKEFE